MKVYSKEEINILLENCKAVGCTTPKNGGNFYKVKSQSFLFPDGTVQDREYIDKRKASIVVPVTNEGSIVLIIQPIALSKEGALIEFPAGYWEFCENGFLAARRELAEETGYIPEELIYLGSHYQDPGCIRQSVDAFLALGCKKIKEQSLDEYEFIKYIEVPFDLALKLMEEGYLKDANSYIAFSKSEQLIRKKVK